VKVIFLIVLAIAILGTGVYFTYDMLILPKKALQEEKAQPPPPPPPDPTVQEFEKAKAIRMKSGKTVEAREALATFVERYPESSRIGEAKDLLGDINVTLFLSSKPTPEKQVYLVLGGDVIGRVANKLKVPPEQLMRTNPIKKAMLLKGQKLIYAPADFSVVISRKRNNVTLLNNGRFFKQYAIRTAPPPSAKAGPQPKLTGKVRDKVATLGGERVTLENVNFWDSEFSVETTVHGYAIYPEPDENALPPAEGKAPKGFAIDPAGCTELAALLSLGDPVTLE